MSDIVAKDGKVAVLRPAYVKEFQCDGTKCDSKCCHNWGIVIDDDTIARWQKIKDKKLRQYVLSQFPKDAEGHHVVKMKDHACPMLQEDKLCFLQKNFGAGYLSMICRTYPRYLNRGRNFLMEGMSMTCPVAEELALCHGPLHLSVDWVTVEEMQGLFCYTGREFPAGFAEDTLRVATAILEDAQYSIDARLALLGFYADTLEDALKAGNADAFAIGQFFLDDSQVHALLQSLPFDRSRYLAAMASLENQSAADGEPSEKQDIPADYWDWRSHFQRNIAKLYDPMLSNYLVNSLFTEGFPIGSTRTMLEDFRIFVYRWKYIEYRLICRTAGMENVGVGDFLSLLSEEEQATLHRADWMNRLAQRVFEEKDMPLVEWMSTLLNTHDLK